MLTADSNAFVTLAKASPIQGGILQSDECVGQRYCFAIAVMSYLW
jgi:hypothetical protein